MKLYRGYNKDYPNWGIRPNQNYIWTTDDIDYALEYAKLFDNGGLVEFDVDESQLDLANDYNGEELFGDEWYDFGGIIDADNDMVQVFIDNGFNSVLLDNSGIYCYLLFDKHLIKSAKELPIDYDENVINEVLRIAGTTYSEKEKKVDEAYQKYKKMYRESHKKLPDDSIIFRESPASYLTYVKNYIKKVLDYEPNAYNYPVLVENNVSYWNRIAGFYNIDTKEFEFIRPDMVHPDEMEHYDNNWVRFFIADMKHRAMYVSHYYYDVAFEGYKALKKKYKDFAIEYFVVEWYENNDWQEITFDAEGKKANISYIYKEFQEYILPFYKQCLCENSKDILRNSNIKLNESWTDSYELYDIYENYQPRNVLSAFEYDSNKNIWFPLIKPTEYKKALMEFMKMNEFIHFPKDKVFKWLEIIMKNTCILNSMTALAGHESWFPFDDCIDVYPELEDEKLDFSTFATFLEEKGFYDWCKLPDGSDAWSDYGIEPIMKIIDEYNDQMTAEQILVLVNRCLDVWHHRGDLASAFIEGGSASLTKISNECVQNKENILTEGRYTVHGITFYEDPSIRWIKTQLNNGKELRVAIDGDLDEPYFGIWLVWDAYSANHNKAFQILGMYEDDSINLRLSKDAITYWGYSDNQMSKLSQCEDIQKLYPNGYKLVKEW